MIIIILEWQFLKLQCLSHIVWTLKAIYPSRLDFSSLALHQPWSDRDNWESLLQWISHWKAQQPPLVMFCFPRLGNYFWTETKRESSFVTNSGLVLLVVRLSCTLFSELPQTDCCLRQQSVWWSSEEELTVGVETPTASLRKFTEQSGRKSHNKENQTTVCDKWTLSFCFSSEVVS